MADLQLKNALSPCLYAAPAFNGAINTALEGAKSTLFTILAQAGEHLTSGARAGATFVSCPTQHGSSAAAVHCLPAIRLVVPARKRTPFLLRSKPALVLCRAGQVWEAAQGAGLPSKRFTKQMLHQLVRRGLAETHSVLRREGSNRAQAVRRFGYRLSERGRARMEQCACGEQQQ